MGGATVKVDRRLADALFLHRHPGWTWDDLQSAPSDIVGMMRLLDTTEQQVRAHRDRQQRG